MFNFCNVSYIFSSDGLKLDSVSSKIVKSIEDFTKFIKNNFNLFIVT